MGGAWGSFPFTNPRALAERGEGIYKRRYQQDFERLYLGKFVAIDVSTELAYVGDSPIEALSKAKEQAPEGIFHLLRVGATAAFHVSSGSNAQVDWTLP